MLTSGAFKPPSQPLTPSPDRHNIRRLDILGKPTRQDNAFTVSWAYGLLPVHL